MLQQGRTSLMLEVSQHPEFDKPSGIQHYLKTGIYVPAPIIATSTVCIGEEFIAEVCIFKFLLEEALTIYQDFFPKAIRSLPIQINN